MPRRSVPPPKPTSPILTAGQKRRRIERLQKCITRLEASDPQKAQKRAPAYLGYNQAATLDPSPLLTNATLRSPVLRPVGGPSVGAPGRHDAHEARQHFSENKERSIALIRKAISTLEDEIADAEPVVEAVQVSKAAPVVSRSPGVGVHRRPAPFRAA